MKPGKEYFINESIKLANKLRQEMNLDNMDDISDEEIIFIVMIYHYYIYMYYDE